MRFLFSLWPALIVWAIWSASCWIGRMLRAPAFVYAARLCAESPRKSRTRTYWRRIVSDVFLIIDSADVRTGRRRIEMRCPRLDPHFFEIFTSNRGGRWLERIDENRWQVTNSNLQKLGHRFSMIEVTIDYAPGFGARIVATKKVPLVNDASGPQLSAV